MSSQSQPGNSSHQIAPENSLNYCSTESEVRSDKQSLPQQTELLETRLARLGMRSASDKLKELEVRRKKLLVAYEHYRYVREEKLDQFNQKLMEQSRRDFPREYFYDRLKFTPLAEFDQLPPEEVLTALEQAQARGCFDAFEVCSVESVRVMKDPILFGRVNGCPDRFYIAQWDDDVRIEQILEAGEG